jgi:4-hydroxy-tetrahydrodipicolinate synthase
MLKGTYTAIVTPFNEDGSIDEESYRALVEEQIKAGVTGIVPCGSTGESSTLDHKEHIELIKITVDQVKARCEILAGTGSNSTREAIEMTKNAEKLGITSTLQIVPYYNKPTQKGLYLHFKAIAESVKIPVIVYNIQGRTAINLETSTLADLAKINNISGVKEGSGNIFQIMEVIKTMPKDFSVLIGDDKLTFLLMALGGHGVISVASNVIPKRIVDFVNLGLKNDFIAMREEHFKLDELFNKLFIETNPIPVKKILALKGKIKSFYRMPLCEPGEGSVKILEDLIKKYNI